MFVGVDQVTAQEIPAYCYRVEVSNPFGGPIVCRVYFQRVVVTPNGMITEHLEDFEIPFSANEPVELLDLNTGAKTGQTITQADILSAFYSLVLSKRAQRNAVAS